LDKEGKYLGVEDFITGWLTKEGTALGRPVDIMIRPDGTVFVSDDKAGVIYRVVRKDSQRKAGMSWKRSMPGRVK
jgi:glucose/arabinose dehydrogenase